jgi:hypothetical protein
MPARLRSRGATAPVRERFLDGGGEGMRGGVRGGMRGGSKRLAGRPRARRAVAGTDGGHPRERGGRALGWQRAPADRGRGGGGQAGLLRGDAALGRGVGGVEGHVLDAQRALHVARRPAPRASAARGAGGRAGRGAGGDPKSMSLRGTPPPTTSMFSGFRSLRRRRGWCSRGDCAGYAEQELDVG